MSDLPHSCPQFLIPHVFCVVSFCPQMSTTLPRHLQGPSGLPSTPSIDSPMSSTVSGIASPFQSGGQPITPPPTPPRRHYYPRHLLHDYPPSSSSPSPS